MIEDVLSGIVSGLLGDSIVEPSCINRRDTFPDTCSAISESVGLVAEYEWASAYWVCWYEEKGWWPYGSVKQCWHFPLPIGLAYGGATDNGYNPGSFLGFLSDLRTNFFGKGHSRKGYRTECIFIDGERWDVMGCGSETLRNGHGANTGLKSYVRVYGDDRDAYDDSYYGAPALPWLLNEDFFNGGGTIVVGLARKNRNAFETLLGAIEEKTNIFSLFTPLKGSHLVAFAAGRAAYAPRTGVGVADGPDSFNESGNMRYDLHYDATAKNLGPRLPSGDLFDASWRAQKSAMEKAPYFYGCVCTTDGNSPDSGKMQKTYNRLRRQWNLCQTDWDGVLLPLRFARSPIGEWFSNKTGDDAAPALKDSAPEWAPGEFGESAMELSQILMSVNKSDPEDPMLWQRLDGNGTASLEELLHQGGGSDGIEWKFDTAGFGRMIWARRVL